MRWASMEVAYAELLPDGKVAVIAELESQGRLVAMAGDMHK